MVQNTDYHSKHSICLEKKVVQLVVVKETYTYRQIDINQTKLAISVTQVFHVLADFLSILLSIIERAILKSPTIILCLPNFACSSFLFYRF